MPVSALYNAGEIVLDGSSYWIKPDSYHMHQPRIRKATIRADGTESYVDLGVGKRAWTMVVLCYNDLMYLDGTPLGITGEQFRAALRNSYTVSSIGTTISFTSPSEGPFNVHFDDYHEFIMDLHTQQVYAATGAAVGMSYEVAITLIEA